MQLLRKCRKFKSISDARVVKPQHSKVDGAVVVIYDIDADFATTINYGILVVPGRW